MKRLTQCVYEHYIDEDETTTVKEYCLDKSIEFDEFTTLEIPRKVYNCLGMIEDLVEKYNLEDVPSLCKFVDAAQEIVALQIGYVEVIRKENLGLYRALYEQLEKEDIENVASRIDYLTNQNNSCVTDLYKANKIIERLRKQLEDTVDNKFNGEDK